MAKRKWKINRIARRQSRTILHPKNCKK